MFKKLTFLLAATLLFACSSGDLAKKKAELESLKKQQSDLKEKIDNLENEITAMDSTAGKTDKRKLTAIVDLQPTTFSTYIEVQGKVDADENVSVSTEMPGMVTKINVKAGDEVSKGQILAETDNKVLVQGIAELQNGLDLATTLFNKQKNLWDQKIGTEVQYLAAKNQKESLEKKMASLQQQLEMTRIKSPIDGTVDAVDIKVGQMAAPGLPAIRVVNFENMKIKGEVAESYASRVKKGNPVMVLFPDMNDTLKTMLDYSAKVINPMSRTFTVQIRLDNKAEYHPNMVAVLKIIDYSNEKALLAPVSVVQKAEEGEFVFLNDNGKAKKVKVRSGRSYNGKIELVDGVKAGDKLIIKGYQDLNEGEEIRM